MIGRTFVLLAAIVATGVPVRAEDNPLVGTWRLISFDREIVATKEVVHAFGGHAAGFSTYAADGRYMSMIVDATRKPPAQPTATDAEAISLYRTMNAFAGQLSYRGKHDYLPFRHYLESDRKWRGTDTPLQSRGRSSHVHDATNEERIPQ
jgi:hypothetical protein